MLFHVAVTEAEAVVEPDGVVDNGGREPVRWITEQSSAIRLLFPDRLKFTMPGEEEHPVVHGLYERGFQSRRDSDVRHVELAHSTPRVRLNREEDQ